MEKTLGKNAQSADEQWGQVNGLNDEVIEEKLGEAQEINPNITGHIHPV